MTKSVRYWRATVRAMVSAGTLSVALLILTGQPKAAPQDVAKLAVEVDRAEGVRAVKALQVAYAQYNQVGMWRETGALFSSKGEAIYGNDNVKGPVAIAAYLRKAFGVGQDGLAPGALNVEFAMTPVINLSADGNSATGRWHVIAMRGKFGASADWAGGIMDNDYVREGGVWKIVRLHYFPQFAGPYEKGWRNIGENTSIVPFRFTPETAGTPIPPLPADVKLPELKGSPTTALRRLSARIATLNDEDSVRNLQNIYGYYVNENMWDDITDLVTPDAVLEAGGIGIYSGPTGIRKYLETIGPKGLRHGELNDEIQLDVAVKVAPDGLTAQARGLEWDFLGDADHEKGYWGVRQFVNSYRKINDVWHIREIRLYPVMKTDYYQGWAKSAVIDPVPPPNLAPDGPLPTPDTSKDGQAIPVFFLPNPASGKMPVYPKGANILATTPLLSVLPAYVSTADYTLEQAALRLNASEAYDATDNLNSAFGDYLTDHQGVQFGNIFATKGMRQGPYAGIFTGPEHIARDEMVAWGPDGPVRDLVRTHLKLQPVIDVSPDARSAKLRSWLLLFPSSYKITQGIYDGIYNDQVVLVNGVWKFWAVAIDDQYFNGATYEAGWAKAKDPVAAPPRRGPPRAVTGHRDPPDIPITDFGERERGLRGGIPPIVEWPSIKPMWFSYVNPVSGRVPLHYWPDCLSCISHPETSLKANGY